MKLATSMLLILFGAAVICAQSGSQTSESGGLEVIKFSWSKERTNWERDPFGGPLENFDEMRSRVRNERRIATGGGDKAKRDAKADEANLALLREKGPARYVFVYKVKVTNKSTSVITTIDWDYVFFERGTENEVGRQQFTSDEHIGQGKTKELTVTIISPPTRTVSLTALNLDEHKQFSERVVLLRVQYGDGRVWQAQQE